MSSNRPGLPARHTRRSVTALTCALITVSLSGSIDAAEMPHGTPIEARLLTPLSTYTAKPGLKIAAAVATPVCASGINALPEGTELRGVVKGVSKVGLGLIHESASLRLEFTQLHLPDGREYTVSAHLAGIDNARERVDRKGKIHGTRATATLSNRLGERLVLEAFVHPAAMIPFYVAESFVFHFPDPEIEFRRGTAIQLGVELPSEFGPVAPCPLPEVETSAEQWGAMQQVVNELPYWAYSKRQPQPMDLVNLLFVGSQEEVDRAFAAAGWIGSRENSMRAGVAAIRAIVEQRGYSDAPMRVLLLDGREPDFRLQKSLDTFEKRDHLRIWRREAELDGRSVWASAATRDVGTTFGMHPFGFTHEIQDEVDLEREKVVHDLIFTGCVDSVAYVSRPAGVRANGQEYRKGVSTDGRVALIELNGCRQPREDSASGEPSPKPSAAVRYIRRVTLTARNHFLRDNLVYRTADAARLGYLALRNLNRHAKHEEHARKMEASIHSPPVDAPQ